MNNSRKNYLTINVIKKSILYIAIIFFLLIFLNTLFPSISLTTYAGKSFIIPSINNKNDIYDGGSDYIPDISEYPFSDSNSIISVGFDTLYGTSKDFFVYKGEIPYKLYENKDYEEWAGKYRYFDGEKIGSHKRPWTIDDHGIVDEDKLKESYDPHIDSMRRENNFDLVSFLGFGAVKFVHTVTSLVVKIFITIQGFDISTLTAMIDKSGSLSKQLSTIFLINPDGGISPFLVFGLGVFLVSFIGMAFKTIKGDQKTSFRKLINEFLFFVLAIAIASIFLVNSNASKISNIGTNILGKLSVDLVTSNNSDTSLFIYDTGNPNSDTLASQKGILNKIFIDQLIKANFGFPVDELDIFDGNGKSDFGNPSKVRSALQKTFENGGYQSFVVCIDQNKINKVNNLGYYLYAANSGVKISRGASKSTAPFAKNGTSISTATSDRVLFVIDFLSYLREEYEENNEAMVSKIDKIIRHLNKPDYYSIIWSVLLISIQNCFLILALGGIILFSIIGQLIVVLGSYCMVIMPVLLLFNNTRRLAKQMTWTYLFGFFRYLIGSTLFNIVLLISTLLCSGGSTFGIVASGVIAFLLFRFLPDLLTEINNQISQLERGRGLSQMSGIYRGMNSISKPFTHRERSRRLANAMIRGEDGKLTRRGTTTERIQRGLEKGFKFQEKCINPFGEKRKKYNEERLKELEGLKTINEEDFENILFNTSDEDSKIREDVMKLNNNNNDNNNNSSNFGDSSAVAATATLFSSLLDRNNDVNIDNNGEETANEFISGLNNEEKDLIMNKFNDYFEKGYFSLDENGNVIYDENGLPTVLDEFKEEVEKDALIDFMDANTINALNLESIGSSFNSYNNDDYEDNSNPEVFNMEYMQNGDGSDQEFNKDINSDNDNYKYPMFNSNDLGNSQREIEKIDSTHNRKDNSNLVRGNENINLGSNLGFNSGVIEDTEEINISKYQEKNDNNNNNNTSVNFDNIPKIVNDDNDTIMDSDIFKPIVYRSKKDNDTKSNGLNDKKEGRSFKQIDLNDPTYDIKTRKQARMQMESGDLQKPIGEVSPNPIISKIDSNVSKAAEIVTRKALSTGNIKLSRSGKNINSSDDANINNTIDKSINSNNDGNSNGNNHNEQKPDNIIRRGIKITKEIKQNAIDVSDQVLKDAGREDLMSHNRDKLKEDKKNRDRENRNIILKSSSGISLINGYSRKLAEQEKQIEADKKAILGKLEKIAIESNSGEMNLEKAMEQIKKELLRDVSAGSIEYRSEGIMKAYRSITEKERQKLAQDVRKGRDERITRETKENIRIEQEKKDRETQEEILTLLRNMNGIANSIKNNSNNGSVNNNGNKNTIVRNRNGIANGGVVNNNSNNNNNNRRVVKTDGVASDVKGTNKNKTDIKNNKTKETRNIDISSSSNDHSSNSKNNGNINDSGSNKTTVKDKGDSKNIVRRDDNSNINNGKNNGISTIGSLKNKGRGRKNQDNIL